MLNHHSHSKDNLKAGRNGNADLQKIFEKLEDDERRTLLILSELGTALLSAGLVVNIVRWLGLA
jgi:hypothetical protein